MWGTSQPADGEKNKYLEPENNDHRNNRRFTAAKLPNKHPSRCVGEWTDPAISKWLEETKTHFHFHRLQPCHQCVSLSISNSALPFRMFCMKHRNRRFGSFAACNLYSEVMLKARNKWNSLSAALSIWSWKLTQVRKHKDQTGRGMWLEVVWNGLAVIEANLEFLKRLSGYRGRWSELLSEFSDKQWTIHDLEA